MEDQTPQVVVYSSPIEMEAALADWLETHAAKNNLLLGMLYRTARRATAGGEVDAFMMAVFSGGVPKLAFLNVFSRTEMIFAAAESGWEPCMDAAIAHLQALAIPVMGIVGPDPQVQYFADRFAPVHKLLFRQKIWQLDKVIPPQPAPGKPRIVEPADVSLIAEWATGFFHEALQRTLAPAEALQLARNKILDKSLVVWENGEACCMAGLERPTRNGITVVLVYTPHAARGHGYASNLVGYMSAEQLRRGRRFLCLHTDAGFPTSNKIYSALGYYEVGAGRIIHFDPS